MRIFFLYTYRHYKPEANKNSYLCSRLLSLKVFKKIRFIYFVHLGLQVLKPFYTLRLQNTSHRWGQPWLLRYNRILENVLTLYRLGLMKPSGFSSFSRCMINKNLEPRWNFACCKFVLKFWIRLKAVWNFLYLKFIPSIWCNLQNLRFKKLTPYITLERPVTWKWRRLRNIKLCQ